MTLAVAALSCAREVTAPTRGFLRMSRGISLITMFPEALRDNAPGTSTLVDVSKVRVVLYRADSTIALDTLVSFPEGKDEIEITMSVPLSPTAPSTGEPLSMGLKYLNPAGDTVFKGAAAVTATATTGTGSTPPAQSVTVTVTYTGAGSSAKSVVATPRSQQAFIGDNFTWSGVAKDASGTILLNTPIKWSSLDPDIASITNAATGVGVANKRGTARIVAELLTGQKDTVALTVLAKSSSLGVSAGNNQSGTVGEKLAAKIVGVVIGTDGAPVSGTAVTVVFASDPNTPVQLTSDANGLVSTDWVLGSTPGAQTATMTATGLSGSPVTFTATAAPGAPVALAVGAVPTSVVAGTTLSTVTVTARDRFNNVATSFVGTVTAALSGTTTTPLNGTKTATAVAGTATFAGLSLNTAATNYALAFTAPNLTAATSASFAVVPAAASALQFASTPASTTADGPIPVFLVNAFDAFGNPAIGFTGTVTLGLTGTTSTAAQLSGTTSATASAGSARFDGARLTKAGTGYQLTASAAGLTGATSGTFAVTPGAPASCAATSPTSFTWFVGSAMPVAPAVRSADAFGNAIAGSTVSFTTSGGGSSSASTATTDATGGASAVWTLGSTAGTQAFSATCAGVTTPTVFTATAQALGIKLNVGESATQTTATVVAGAPLVVPILLDLTYPNGDNVASLSFDVQFDSTRFSLVSTAVGSFGSVLENTAAAASTGKISVGVFAPTSATATTTVYTVTLLAKPGSSGTSTVGLVVTAAGRDNATNVVVLPRNMTVTITP